MKVALVHDFLIKLGGAERVLKSLSELFPAAPIYTLLYDEKIARESFSKDRVVTSFLQNYPGFIRRKHRYLLTKMPRAIEEFDFSGFDLVISSSNAFAHGILTPLNTKHLCYCHSPMRYAWDWVNEYRKENKIYGLKKMLYTPIISYLRFWDKITSDRPTKYLANSNTVKQRIKKYYHADSEIVYPPVDTNRFKASTSNENYFLIVSTLTPYKKIDLAIALFNKIGRKLVIIGDGPSRTYLQSMANDNIEFLGFKSDDVVKEYMENCRAFIFPGEEDFGITPVEAMSAGKPILAFAKGGLTETVKSGKTGEFFFSPTIKSMEDGLARLLYNEKYYRPQTIRRHALNFSSDIFNKKIKQQIKKI
ncbi:glycosyltransferase [Candidatus Peregrinibacteria bacterium]|nr:glycosyltransferase [Candidatus Peregrinibacteria bacterium]